MEKILEWVSEVQDMNERLRKDVKETTQEIEDMTEFIIYELKELKKPPSEGGV